MLQPAVMNPANAVRLYTPRAVALATFLGSPLAGAILMAMNYRRLGRRNDALWTFVLGVLGSAAVIAISFALPEHVPSSPIAVALVVAMYGIAKSFQGHDVAEHIRYGRPRASYWKAAGVGVICLFVILAPIFLIAMMTSTEAAAFGKPVEVMPKQFVYYSGDATEGQARNLGRALEQAHLFAYDRSTRTVFLSKHPGETVVKFVVGDGRWDNPETVEDFRKVGQSLVDAGIGRPLKVELCDQNVQVKREIRVE